MSPNIQRSWQSFLLLLYIFVSSDCMVDNVSNISDCQLWHFVRNGYCQCGAMEHGVVECNKYFIYVKQGSCVTWNNETSSAELHRCLFTKWSDYTCAEALHDIYRISTAATSEKLNNLTCGHYNRQGRQCTQCIDGYGPALFTDDATCADCSKYRHLWILNLLFQLFMVTVLCLLLLLFQIKGTSSPFNVVIMYAQLASLGLKLGGSIEHARLVCHIGRHLTGIIVTILGIFNLDFFHNVIPPLCISPTLKSIDILLFDYIIASYPLFLTMLLYLCIVVYDRQTCFMRSSLRKCIRMFVHTSWNPKRNILNTFATFLLLSYSKILFTSIQLLLAFQSYNSHGKRVSSSALLLYDPTIRFFHSEHIPYATVALLVLLVFIILPVLLLLAYSTTILRKCLTCLGFRRWDILDHIMDIFQGWYKDGTDSTRDYRPLSAFYLLLRVVVSCEFVVQMLNKNYNLVHGIPRQWLALGIFNILLGAAYLALKPYKQKWMSNFDGSVTILAGILLLLHIGNSRSVYILGGMAACSTMIALFIYATYQNVYIKS